MSPPVSPARPTANSLTLDRGPPLSPPKAGGRGGSQPLEPEAPPPEVREYWRVWLAGRCLSFAELLNLVAIGEKQIARLPTHVHAIAVHTLSDLQERCCRGEMARGGRRTERLHDDAQRELWRMLRPFAQRDTHGKHYVEHLIGPPEVQQEFLRRIGEDVPRGTISPVKQT